LIRSVLDKLATKYDEIFQLYPNNVATLPCKKLNVAVFDKLKWNDVNVCLFGTTRTSSNRIKKINK